MGGGVSASRFAASAKNGNIFSGGSGSQSSDWNSRTCIRLICRLNVLTQVLDRVQNSIESNSLTDAAELLRQNGVAITAQRLAVLRAVSDRPHGTADVIAAEVRDKIGVISRQAVYDALGLLARKGLIRRIQPAGSPALYEDRVGDEHHHVICRTCGKTADVDCAVGKTPCLIAADAAGFQIDEAEVIYWGTCPDCRAAT